MYTALEKRVSRKFTCHISTKCFSLFFNTFYWAFDYIHSSSVTLYLRKSPNCINSGRSSFNLHHHMARWCKRLKMKVPVNRPQTIKHKREVRHDGKEWTAIPLARNRCVDCPTGLMNEIEGRHSLRYLIGHFALWSNLKELQGVYKERHRDSSLRQLQDRINSK